MAETKIDVLDHGYVRLVDHMGSDLSVVNSARVSFNKAVSELKERDAKLIKFLAEQGHTSPFRHAFLQFEVYAPLMVARQWWKYVVASDHVMDAWNESSRRYITEEPVFYVPQADEWRSAPENRKQGSGEAVGKLIGQESWERLMKTVEDGLVNYNWALENNICAEQARLFLPAYGIYVRWYWSCSLQSACHFLSQRLSHDAQAEITAFAQAVLLHVKEHFSVSLEHLVKD